MSSVLEILLFLSLILYVRGDAQPSDLPADSGRFRFTVNLTAEKYTPALGNSDSLDFKLLSHELAARFVAVFQDMEGNQTTVLEKIEESSTGAVIAKMHLTSYGFNDEDEIRRRIFTVLVQGFIGRFNATVQGFVLVPTTNSSNVTAKWNCPKGSYWCKDGSCIRLERACDGTPQCADKSDEEDCEPKLVSVVVHPHAITVKAGRRAQFFCGGADIRNKMKWTKKNGNITNQSNVSQRTGRLLITNTTEADSGIYVCTAERALEGSSANVTLTVVPRDGSAGDSKPDRYVELTISIASAYEGTSAEVGCNVESEEDETVPVTWSKIGGDLPTTANLTDGGHTLYIPKLALEDSGFYECRPTNIDTSDGAQNVAQIIVVPKPKASLSLRKKKPATGA